MVCSQAALANSAVPRLEAGRSTGPKEMVLHTRRFFSQLQRVAHALPELEPSTG